MSLPFARALLGALGRGGVRHAVISPGARSFPLAAAAAETPGLTLHLCIDERSAAFLALGLARGSGAPALFICTSGSAGAHALPAVLEARYGGVPLVILTADRPAELHEVGALQTVEQQFFAPHAPRFVLEPSLGAAPLATRIAQLLAAAAAPGPVHVNVPLAEPLWSSETAAPQTTRSAPTIDREPPLPSRRQLAELARRFAGARGVIWCGPVAPDSALPAAASRLAARLRWPLVSEPASQLVFGNGAPELIATGAAFLRNAPRALAPEVVLGFGASPTARVSYEWLGQAARDRLVLVDANGGLQDPQHAAAALLVADPAAVADGLGDLAPAPAPADWLARWRRADDAARRVLADAAATGFWEGAVARTVLAAAPADAALHLGNSLPIRDAALFGGPGGPRRAVFTSRGTSGIDGGVATVLGEAAGAGVPMVALLGDVAFAHDLASLFNVERRSDATFVIVDNGGGGIFRTLPLAAAGEPFVRFCLTPTGIDVGAICAAAGVPYARVESSSELARALAEVRGVRVVHAVVDGAAGAETRARAVQAAATAVSKEMENV